MSIMVLLIKILLNDIILFVHMNFLQVIDEGLLLPLYHCFGSAITDGEESKREMRNRIKTGLLICSVVYTVFEGSISLATPALVDLVSVSPIILICAKNLDRLNMKIFHHIYKSV